MFCQSDNSQVHPQTKERMKNQITCNFEHIQISDTDNDVSMVWGQGRQGFIDFDHGWIWCRFGLCQPKRSSLVHDVQNS